MEQSRRKFLKTASAVSAAAVLSPNVFSAPSHSGGDSYPLCLFTKCLQFLDYQQLGEALADMGFTGADLSVRPKGHVLPENVKKDLPKAVKALKKSGVGVPMMVTAIRNAEDPDTETILGTAAELGVRHYRMGYISYDPDKTIPENLDIHKKTIENLEKMNRKFGIQGCYQNHNGSRVGGPVWDLYSIIKDCDPEFIGIQYDIRHAMVEGAGSWPLGMKLLSPWISNTAIKDHLWKIVDGKWKVTHVPLGEGMVDYNAYFEEYIKLGIKGPVTLHVEHDLGGANKGSRNPTMSQEEIMGHIQKDLAWLKNKFDEQGISGY